MAENKKVVRERATGFELAHKQLMSAVDTLGRIRINEPYSYVARHLMDSISEIAKQIVNRQAFSEMVPHPAPNLEPPAYVPDDEGGEPGEDVPF